MNADITPGEAAEALAKQSDIRAHVAAGAARLTAFLISLTVASSLFVLAIGLFSMEDVRAIVTLAIGFVVWVIVLCATLLPGARVYPRGFNIRWGVAMGVWGTAFGLALGLGLGLQMPEPWFWVMAVVVAVPAIVIVWLELRSPRG